MWLVYDNTPGSCSSVPWYEICEGLFITLWKENWTGVAKKNVIHFHPVLCLYCPNKMWFITWIGLVSGFYSEILQRHYMVILSTCIICQYIASSHLFSFELVIFCFLIMRLFPFILARLGVGISYEKSGHMNLAWTCVHLEWTTKTAPWLDGFLKALSTIYPMGSTESMPSYASFLYNVCQTFLICIILRFIF